MKKTILFALFLTISTGLFSLDCEIKIWEEAYYDISGIWYYEGFKDIKPLWLRSNDFSWGYIEDYDPEQGSIIDIGAENVTIDPYTIISIEKENGIYKLGVADDLGSVIDTRGFIYIRLQDNKLLFLDKVDSLTGNATFEKRSGPTKDKINHTAVSSISSNLYIIPSNYSPIIGGVKKNETLKVNWITTKSEDVKNLITWVKVRLENGTEGWIEEDKLQYK